MRGINSTNIYIVEEENNVLPILTFAFFLLLPFAFGVCGKELLLALISNIPSLGFCFVLAKEHFNKNVFTVDCLLVII